MPVQQHRVDAGFQLPQRLSRGNRGAEAARQDHMRQIDQKTFAATGQSRPDQVQGRRAQRGTHRWCDAQRQPDRAVNIDGERELAQQVS